MEAALVEEAVLAVDGGVAGVGSAASITTVRVDVALSLFWSMAT